MKSPFEMNGFAYDLEMGVSMGYGEVIAVFVRFYLQPVYWVGRGFSIVWSFDGN
jgi:hypothetical protein